MFKAYLNLKKGLLLPSNFAPGSEVQRVASAPEEMRQSWTVETDDLVELIRSLQKHSELFIEWAIILDGKRLVCAYRS